MVCRSIGFLGQLRVQLREHTVIETHPDNENPDLRLETPWPALRQHLDKIDIESLDKKERSHVPALTILYYYLEKYKSIYGGKLPESRQERGELKDMIRAGGRDDDQLILGENFNEAVHFVNTCIGQCKVPSRIQNILDDDRCRNLTQEVSAQFLHVQRQFLFSF